MSDFKITGIRVHNPPYRADGAWVLASVVVESGVFTVAGVSLVQTDAGQCLVYLPKFEKRARVILSSSVGFPALLEAVLTAFRALGGAFAATPVATASSAEHPHADHS